MSVHKNTKNNTWYVKYKNKTFRGFKTKHDAQLHEAKLKIESKIEVTNIYIYDVAKDFLETYKTKVTYGTYAKNENIINNIILPNIKNSNIHKITELDCRDFQLKVLKMEYSTIYKNRIIGAYKMLFKHAQKYFKLSNNPTHIMDNFKLTYEEKIKEKSRELNVWNDEEFNSFIQQVNKPMYKELFIVLYYTGIRLGEALALKWSDFDNGKLSINKSLTRKTNKGSYELKEPKNISSIRHIDLGESLNTFLINFKSNEMKMCSFNNDWFMFGRLNPLPQTTIDRVKEKAIKNANVRRIRIHDFRHSHASNLIANGINIVAVSKRLGHSDINMTLKVYTHLLEKNEEELRSYINKSSHNLLTAIKNA